MFRSRRGTDRPDRRKSTDSRQAVSDRVVGQAEAIVHSLWLEELAERHQEVWAALQRATARCDAAQRSLTAAQQSGDPRGIAAAHDDLETAKRAARTTLSAWDRLQQFLAIEAALAPLRRSTRQARQW